MAPSKNTDPEEQWTISAKNHGHTSKLEKKKPKQNTEGWKLIPESRKMSSTGNKEIRSN